MSRSPATAESLESAQPYSAAFRTLFRMYEKGMSWSGRERHCVFLNTGGRRFADVSATSGLDLPDDGRSVGLTDWDHDGDLDLWISNRTAPQLRFFLNRLDRNRHSLALHLEGRTVNRDAIGARVEVALRTPEGEATRLHKTLAAGSGFLSQSSKWLHFGLGESERIDEVVVRWPGGAREAFPGLQADRRYRLVEGGGASLEPPRTGLDLGEPRRVEPPPPTTAGRVLVTARPPLPPLRYRTADGATAEIVPSGSPPTLVNLWAAWCLPCRGELQALTSEREAIRRSGLDILALSVDGLDPSKGTGPADAARMLDELDFPFEHGFADDALLSRLQVLSDALFTRRVALAVPTSFLLTADREVAAIYRGPVEPDRLLADLAELEAPLARRRQLATPFSGRWLAPPVVLPESWIAQRFLDEDLLDDAVWYLRASLGQRPDDAGVYTRIADLLFKKGDAEGAERHYREALRRQADDVRAVRHLADLLVDRGRIEEALPLFERAEALAPAAATTHYNHAVALQRLGRLPAAVEAYRAAIAADPGYVDAYNNLAILLAQGGDADGAIEALRRAVALRPGSPEAHNNLGILLAQRGDVESAIEAFRQAIAARGDFAEAHNNLGVLLRRAGHLDEAIEHFRRAVEIRPDFADARANLRAAAGG